MAPTLAFDGDGSRWRPAPRAGRGYGARSSRSLAGILDDGLDAAGGRRPAAASPGGGVVHARARLRRRRAGCARRRRAGRWSAGRELPPLLRRRQRRRAPRRGGRPAPERRAFVPRARAFPVRARDGRVGTPPVRATDRGGFGPGPRGRRFGTGAKRPSAKRTRGGREAACESAAEGVRGNQPGAFGVPRRRVSRPRSDRPPGHGGVYPAGPRLRRLPPSAGARPRASPRRRARSAPRARPRSRTRARRAAAPTARPRAVAVEIAFEVEQERLDRALAAAVVGIRSDRDRGAVPRDAPA